MCIFCQYCSAPAPKKRYHANGVFISYGAKQNFISDDAWPLDTANEAIEVMQIQFPNLKIENQIAADAQGFYNDNLVMLALVANYQQRTSRRDQNPINGTRAGWLNVTARG